MIDDDLEIPVFLRREPNAPATVASDAPQISTPVVPPKLTAARKDRIAGAVIAAVERGADTFGQIRKALGARYSDRDLRAGIRAGKHWQPRLKPGTMGGRPVMRRERVALVQTGRRYSVIKA